MYQALRAAKPAQCYALRMRELNKLATDGQTDKQTDRHIDTIMSSELILWESIEDNC
jgi:hypothetical protein